MSIATAYSASVTTDGAGAATVYIGPVWGRLVNVIYTKTNFDNGVTFAITTETTGQSVWSEAAVNASKTVAPRQATHDVLGAASLYAVGGEPVEDCIRLCQERLKIVVSAGGAAKTGTFTLIVDGP